MHVLLDTNIYLSDLTFSTPEFIALRSYLQKTGHKILLPSIVQREIDKNLAAKAQEEVTRIFGLHSSRLGLLHDPPSHEQIKQALQNSLRKNVFSRGLTQMIETEVTLETLVARSLEEIPPFKDKGRGFRDALIWYCLLDYLRLNPDSTVAFISNNPQDFGKDALKPELINELEQMNASPRLIYFNTLTAFLDKFGKPLDFINDDLINASIRDLAEIYAGTVSNSDISISDEVISDLTDYDVDVMDLRDYFVTHYYVYTSTAQHYWVYVKAEFFFDVVISGWEYSFNFYSNAFDWHTANRSDIGSSQVEFKLKVNKTSHLAEEVDYF